MVYPIRPLFPYLGDDTGLTSLRRESVHLRSMVMLEHLSCSYVVGVLGYVGCQVAHPLKVPCDVDVAKRPVKR